MGNVIFDEAFFDDPYPLYKELRAAGPIHQLEMVGGAWAFPTHAGVTSLYKDPRLSARRSHVVLAQLPQSEQDEFAEFGRLFSTWMWFFDPPQHTRAHWVMSRGFTPEVLAGLRGRVQGIVDELLDAAEARGGMEVLRDFAYPLPAYVIADLLGVPRSARDQFGLWCDDIAEFFGSISATVEMARRAQRSLVALTEYFEGLVGERRRRPADDFISRLIRYEEEGGPVGPGGIHAQCAMLIFSGQETTRNLIGNGLLALLRHPDQLSLLKQNPSLARTAVDEFLRYDSPVQWGSRVAAEDFECYGRRVREGDLILFLLGAANRDPEEFADPDRLDITRAPNRHVSFGHGPHICVGRNLALLEGEIAFNTLLRRMPDVRLASERLEWTRAIGFRGLKSLPVAFSAPAPLVAGGAHEEHGRGLQPA